MIQMSLVDTFAASSAGAYALAGNFLYTKEAFREYYDHLSDNGLLTVSRWYTPVIPGETLRVVSLGVAAWKEAGVNDPSQHIAVLAAPVDPVGTVLLKRSPFTEQEKESLVKLAEEIGFRTVYVPGQQPDNIIAELINPMCKLFIFV